MKFWISNFQANLIDGWVISCEILSAECLWTLLMISQHWLSAVRQQAITRANVDPDLCRHMVSLCHNELRYASALYNSRHSGCLLIAHLWSGTLWHKGSGDKLCRAAHPWCNDFREKCQLYWKLTESEYLLLRLFGLNYTNPGYGLSLVDTLWNAGSYRQPLEQEGNPMTWIEKFWLQISLIVAKKS